MRENQEESVYETKIFRSPDSNGNGRKKQVVYQVVIKSKKKYRQNNTFRLNTYIYISQELVSLLYHNRYYFCALPYKLPYLPRKRSHGKYELAGSSITVRNTDLENRERNK